MSLSSNPCSMVVYVFDSRLVLSCAYIEDLVPCRTWSVHPHVCLHVVWLNEATILDEEHAEVTGQEV